MGQAEHKLGPLPKSQPRPPKKYLRNTDNVIRGWHTICSIGSRWPSMHSTPKNGKIVQLII